ARAIRRSAHLVRRRRCRALSIGDCPSSSAERCSRPSTVRALPEARRRTSRTEPWVHWQEQLRMEVGRNNADELPRGNHLGLFPESRKMRRISSYEVIGASSIRTLQENI